MKAGNDLDYILGAGTFGSDTTTNSCGIVAGHAYSVISAFQLTATDGTVENELYMIRNPWGTTMKTTGLWYEGDNCTDNDNGGLLYDSYGDNCAAWYDDYPGTCGSYDTSTFFANTMCCGCGGGTIEESDVVWTDAYKA